MSGRSGVDERKAEQIAEILLTRYGQPERLARVLNHLEGLAPAQRRGQLDALLAGGLSQGLVSQRESR